MGLTVAMVTPYKVRCGIFTYSENLIRALVKQDVTVYVIRLPRFGRLSSDILQNVVDKIPVPKIDVISVQHEYGLYQGLEKWFYPALKALGKPVVTTCHSAGALEIDRIIAEYSDRIIVHNEFCFRRFNHPEKTGIIPHGASPLKEPPPPMEECKKSLGINPKTPLVGYLGFISQMKGLETLIEAMSKVSKAGLLIGGGWHIERDTEYIFKLKQSTLQLLPQRCRWLGYVSDEDLSRVYASFDILVYPSIFSTESGALITALSHQKAVIARNIAPFREKKKQGALMTFNNVKDLTRKIKRLLKDEELRKKLEDGAKKFCEDTSWTEIATRHVRLYEELLKN